MSCSRLQQQLLLALEVEQPATATACQLLKKLQEAPRQLLQARLAAYRIMFIQALRPT
jgi:hypothetical protein